MAIPTSRTKETAEIKIIDEKCNGCGLCVTICKDFSLVIKDNKARKSDSPLFGCIACGHCMAICPNGAIEISGRHLAPADMFELPAKSAVGGYEQLLALLQRRRSIREFKDKNVEPELIEKILAAARTAPMGLPPSDVNVLIISGKEKNRAFARDFSGYLKGLKYMTSGFFLTLMRPFWGKDNDELFREFINPLFRAYTDEMDRGNNYINYDAPLAMYFYGTPFSDPADPIVAATYAMIAAESLGLGTCMLGGVHPFIQSGRKARKFREDHNIKFKSREGVFVIFGYPSVRFQKGIRRTFASTTLLN
jgi:nitroreductase/NAD-dependent dihydropyrimidine dehydrogenase PreA subunit